MFGASLRTRSRLSIAVVGIALGLAGGQPALADTARPNFDSGGSGDLSVSEEWTFELPFEQGRPVLVEQATAPDDRWTQYTAMEDQRSIMLIEVNESPVAVAEQQSSSVSTRTTSDRSIALIESNEGPVVASRKSQPDFALTQNGQSITLIESKEAPVLVAKSAAVGGYFAIVDEQGNTIVPELAAAVTNERMASAGSASPSMICVACVALE